MKFFGKILKNKSIVSLVAIALCLVILLVDYRYRVSNAINAITIPVAATRIEGRTKITDDLIKTVKVAESLISKDVIRNKNDLLNGGNSVDKYVNYNTFIPEGGLFFKSAVVEKKDMPDSAWADIQDGYTVVYLKVTETTSFGNSIFPGDKIDLYYQYTGSGDKFVGKLIEGITVLAVKDSTGRHIFKKSADQRTASALIFQVPEELHLLYRKAQHITGGVIIPIPRNSSYQPPATTIYSEYIKDFINSQAMDIVDDYVDEQKIDDSVNNNINITE